MPTFDWNAFRQRCDDVTVDGAADMLGGLAPYWLNDAALVRRIDSRGTPMPLSRPELTAEPGCCWPISVNEDSATHGLLRDAMPLPLRWTAHEAHDERLPAGLKDLADAIVDGLGDSFPEIARSCWGLGFAVDNPPDLSSIGGVVVDSAWVSLAAGLAVVATGGSPDRTVWSTGAWSGAGRKWIGGVGGIDRKVKAAVDFGAKTLFVPEANAEEARAAAAKLGTGPNGTDAALQVTALPKDQSKPALSLGPYLARLLADLPAGASRADLRSRYGVLHSFDRTWAKQWHQRRIAPELAPFLRRRFEREQKTRFTHLVTVASGSPELVALAVEALQPDRVLLLHTEAVGNVGGESGAPNKHVENVRKQLRLLSHQADVVERPYAMNSSLRSILATHVAEFVQEAAPENVLFDLTPGQFPVKLALMESVIDKRSNQMFFVHDQDPKGEYVIPFSQRMIFWKPGDTWQLPDDNSSIDD